MDKELFVSTMKQIEELHNEQERFNDILKAIDPEFGGGYIHNKPISIFEDLLRKLINDQYDYISYYMWELDFGKKYEDGVITEGDGTIIKLATPEDLYILIQNSNAE